MTFEELERMVAKLNRQIFEYSTGKTTKKLSKEIRVQLGLLKNSIPAARTMLIELDKAK